ncbi:MAG: GAF domain-containing protein, partial [Pseudomonadota bacterium]|nr:GAF domain-containing protein [Pseudomonadota bacterium]
MQAVSVRDDIVTQCEAITTGESDLIANLANISALIFDQFEDINWAGF